MTVNVQSVNFKADVKLVDFVEERLAKLSHFYDNLINAHVFLKVDNNHSRENKIAELKLTVPGHDFIVTKECKSFEEATDQAADAMTRLLIKHKEKQQENHRR